MEDDGLKRDPPTADIGSFPSCVSVLNCSPGSSILGLSQILVLWVPVIIKGVELLNGHMIDLGLPVLSSGVNRII